MPACSDETISYEVTTAMMPSPNSGAVTPRASLILMSKATNTVPQGTDDVHTREVGTKAPQCAKLALCSEAKGLPLSTDSGAYAASAPKGISKAFSRKFRAKALSRANHLRSNIADKAPQCASLPSSSSAKLALRSGAKGSSLSVDSGAYAASAPKDIPKGLSREVRVKALFSANYLRGDKKNRTSSYVQSNSASVLDHLGPTGSDLREFLLSESLQTSPSYCQQVGCQLVIVHSVYCRLGPIPAIPLDRRSVFDRLSVQTLIKHRKRGV